MEHAFKGGVGVIDWRFSFRTNPFHKFLWTLELNLVTVVKFMKNRGYSIFELQFDSGFIQLGIFKRFPLSI